MSATETFLVEWSPNKRAPKSPRQGSADTIAQLCLCQRLQPVHSQPTLEDWWVGVAKCPVECVGYSLPPPGQAK